jgi:hypothetical protein
MFRITACSLALLLISLTGGCATLLRGSRDNLTFRTVPTGATVIVDGTAYRSPVSLDLKRKIKHYVIVSSEGYRTLRFVVEPQWDGVSLVGNIILPGGSLGLVVDRVSGADLTFFEMADIHLVASSQPDPAQVYNCFKGHLLTDAEVEQAIEAERRDRSQFFRGQP